MVKFVYDQKLQLFIHCNGDAAIDMFLDAHKKAAKDQKPTFARRSSTPSSCGKTSWRST